MVGLQGETVNLSFIGSTDTTHSSSIGIYDAQQKVRPLAANERLIIDRLSGNVSTIVNVLAAAQGTSSATQSTLIVSLTPQNPTFYMTKEGYALPLGVVPSVLNAANTQILLTGSGRIIAESSTSRPAWKESLT